MERGPDRRTGGEGVEFAVEDRFMDMCIREGK